MKISIVIIKEGADECVDVTIEAKNGMEARHGIGEARRMLPFHMLECIGLHNGPAENGIMQVIKMSPSVDWF